MSKYIDADKLIAEIERRKDEWQALINKNNAVNPTAVKEVICEDLNILDIITSLQQEQPDTCIFGNTPSESSCKFCGVECALREPKQTETTSAGLSSKDEAIGLAIMAYLDTKVKHDNAKVCGVSLKVAREWIREKIVNKQEQPEVDIDIQQELYHHFGQVKDFTLGVSIARHFYELGLNARKEE